MKNARRGIPAASVPRAHDQESTSPAMHSAPAINDDDSDLVYELKCRIADLEKALGTGWRAPAVLRLTALQNRVLGAVVARRIIRVSAIFDVLYGADLDPPENESVISVSMHTIRRKLRPHDILIGTDWGRTSGSGGYFITPDNLERMCALYGARERPTPESP